SKASFFKAPQMRSKSSKHDECLPLSCARWRDKAPGVYTTRRIQPQWELKRGNFAPGATTLSQLGRFAVLRYRKVTRMNVPVKGAYGGEPTQTATRGELEALVTGPQEAPRSPRNSA